MTEIYIPQFKISRHPKNRNLFCFESISANGIKFFMFEIDARELMGNICAVLCENKKSLKEVKHV